MKRSTGICGHSKKKKKKKKKKKEKEKKKEIKIFYRIIIRKTLMLEATNKVRTLKSGIPVIYIYLKKGVVSKNFHTIYINKNVNVCY